MDIKRSDIPEELMRTISTIWHRQNPYGYCNNVNYISCRYIYHVENKPVDCIFPELKIHCKHLMGKKELLLESYSRKGYGMKKSTIIRVVVLVVALINQMLVMIDKSPLPFDEGTIEQVISGIFTIGAALTNAWFNNSFTKAAIEADTMKEYIKEGVIDLDAAYEASDIEVESFRSELSDNEVIEGFDGELSSVNDVEDVEDPGLYSTIG